MCVIQIFNPSISNLSAGFYVATITDDNSCIATITVEILPSLIPCVNPVNTFTVDISGYFQSEEQNYGDFNGVWRGGFNISNIGPKVSYSNDGEENFMPTIYKGNSRI